MMDKWIDSPWFLRITALILAILLFFTVQPKEKDSSDGFSSGTQVDVLHNVPVQVYYDDESLIVTGVPKTVDVTIKGPMAIVLQTKAVSDYTVFVDLRKQTIGEHKVTIQHENFSDKLSVQMDPSTIDISIEERVTRTFKIDPEINERLLAEDYYVKSMTANPNTVSVTGAKSVVDSISYVKATVTGEQGLRNSFEQEANVKILDRDMNKLNVQVKPEKIKVNVDIGEYTKEVPVVLNQKGTPGKDITIKSLTPITSKMTLFGSKAALENTKELNVDVDVSKIKNSGIFKIDIDKPEGISRLSEDSIKVQVVVEKNESNTNEEVIKDEEQETDQEETSSIVSSKEFKNVAVDVRNLDEGYRSNFITPKNGLVTLTVKGDEKELANLDINDFDLYIEAADKHDGNHKLPIQVDGPRKLNWSLSNNIANLRIEQIS
ncbi:CdaR family protein [Viridibacillus sp. NPDC093762]|uniref:CdaR family protein n=1 Tax=Viridibacillus sp. NPDC093762 TaxID=3390720 RepID=UPI003D013360